MRNRPNPPQKGHGLAQVTHFCMHNCGLMDLEKFRHGTPLTEINNAVDNGSLFFAPTVAERKVIQKLSFICVGRYGHFRTEWHYFCDPMFSRFDTIPECDRQTDTWQRHPTALSIASRGKNLKIKGRFGNLTLDILYETFDYVVIMTKAQAPSVGFLVYLLQTSLYNTSTTNWPSGIWALPCTGPKNSFFVSRWTSSCGRRTTCSVREDKVWILYLLTALVIGSSVSLLWEMMMWLSLSVSCIRYLKRCIFRPKMRQNALGSRAPPGATGGAWALP